MSLPNIVFRDSGDTTNLPQSGTSYFDWNATDGAGGTSDTPNPLLPNSVGNKQYVRLKNIATATDATASYLRLYIDGVDAPTLSGLGYLRVSQLGIVTTITDTKGTSYDNGIDVTVASGTNGNILSPSGISGTVTLYVVTTATGVNTNNWSFNVGYYYIP